MNQSLEGRTLLNRYFLRNRIGQGGMADVYLAWDNLRSTQLAIKILRRELSSNANLLALFEQEARLLRRLEHPHIVRLYDFEQEQDICFLVMDWIAGSNLKDAIELKGGPFTSIEVSRILLPICSALNYAHQNGVYHCDVKPANILLHQDNRAMLTDFGIARLTTQRIGGGTLPYIAPEQLTGGNVDARTDIYALGVTLYEMVTGGRLPFLGRSANSVGSTSKERIIWEHLHLPVPLPQHHCSGITDEVQAVILKALSKEPAGRYNSALELGEAFEQARGNVTTSPASPPRALPPPHARPKHPPPPPLKRLPPRPPAPPPKLSQFDGPHLVCRRGRTPGLVIHIPPTGPLTIGRSEASQVQLHDRSVSRRHVEITRNQHGVYIEDKRSTFGTFVNGIRVSGTVSLRDRDIVTIGYNEEFEYRMR